ncbi:MAG: AzlC family ABC transporter permease [Pseudomonadales bacterium]
MISKRALLWQGVIQTLPLVLAAFPFGLVFGALAHSYNLSLAATLGFSAIVFAGASQFIAITLLASSTAFPIIVLTVFVVNLRQMLYSANLMPFVHNWSQSWRAFLAFFLTDETFAVVSHQASAPGLRWLYLGSALFMYSFWIVATLAGFLLVGQLPGLANMGLDVAMIVAFVGIVVPSLLTRADWACAATAFACALLTADWPNQTGLLFSALLAIAVGVWSKALVAQ